MISSTSSDNFGIEFDQETDGRWIAEVPELPGVLAYGATKEDAGIAVTALASRVLVGKGRQSSMLQLISVNLRLPSCF